MARRRRKRKRPKSRPSQDEPKTTKEEPIAQESECKDPLTPDAVVSVVAQDTPVTPSLVEPVSASESSTDDSAQQESDDLAEGGTYTQSFRSLHRGDWL